MMSIQNYKHLMKSITSVKAFNRWAVFYTVILIVSLIYNSVYTFQFYDFSDLFINYQGGFIRRGLMGEGLLWLYSQGLNPIYVAYTMSLTAYLIVVLFMVRHFRKHGYALGLLTISFLLGGVGIFGLAFFRRDFIILCLFLLIVRMWKRLPFGRWLIWGNILAMIAILSHEVFAFWAMPLLLLMTHLRTHHWLRALACWIPSILVFLLCLYESGNIMQYQLIKKSTEAFLEYPNVIDFLSFDKGYVMKFHLHYNFLDSVYHIPNVIGSVVSVLLAIYISTMANTVYRTSSVKSTQENLSYSSLFLGLLLCLVPMLTILSTDYTRTLMYASLSSYMVVFSLTESECNDLVPSFFKRWTGNVLTFIKRLLPPTRGKILLMVLFLGTVEWTGQGTFGLLRNSEIGNALMVVYKVMVKLIENISC